MVLLMMKHCGPLLYASTLEWYVAIMFLWSLNQMVVHCSFAFIEFVNVISNSLLFHLLSCIVIMSLVNNPISCGHFEGKEGFASIERFG